MAKGVCIVGGTEDDRDVKWLNLDSQSCQFNSSSFLMEFGVRE